MRCEHCGANIDQASNFCPVCGSKIEKKDQASESVQVNKKTKNVFSKLLKFNKNKINPPDHINSKEGEENQVIRLNQAEEDEPKISQEENLQPANEDLKINPNEENIFKPNSLDRMDKESRRFENLGSTSSPYNQRSVIEKVQAKVTRNQARNNRDEDYYIDDYKALALNKNIEDKLDRLINGKDKELSSLTISGSIRKIQKNTRAKTKADLGQEIIRPVQNEEAFRPKEETAKPINKDLDVGKEASAETKQVDSFQKKYFTKRNLLLALIGLLIAVILGTLYIKMSKADDITIPLSDYINISYEGSDGNAVPKASIDTKKLIDSYGNDIKYISRDNNKDSYGSPAEEFAADLESNVVFQYSKDSGLSNGDEITVMANLDNIKISDKYNVLMSNASKAVIIDGIANDGFTDPFAYIKVKFEGKSPDITLSASLTDDAPEYMNAVDIIPAKTNGIKEGEEVAVSLNFNADEFKNTYNVSLSPTSKNFKASTEEGEKEGEDKEASNSDSEFISTTANLDGDLLGQLKFKAGELIKQTILYKNIISVDKIDYLGSFTGVKEDGSGDIKNKVYLIYEVTTSEKLPDSNFQTSFKYYTFVQFQNVKKAMDADGKFYSQGPITTDNQIFHKFFVESDYKYYQIEYQGFGFIDKALANVGSGLEGFNATEDNKTNITNHFATSDGVVGEYEADGRRLSLKSDGSLTYQIDKAVHIGSYSANGNQVSATIKGVNVDTPVILNYDNGTLKAESQGEFNAISFKKIQNF